MKALAERILKHPLKVIKCFHMPKLLAVKKKIIEMQQRGDSSGQNESRSFQLRSLSFQHSELGEKALKSSA